MRIGEQCPQIITIIRMGDRESEQNGEKHNRKLTLASCSSLAASAADEPLRANSSSTNNGT